MPPFNLNEAVTRVSNARPQRGYLWRMVLPDLQQHVEELKSGDNKNLPSIDLNLGYEIPDYNEISTRIHNISVPFFNIETDKSKVGNSYWYWADKRDTGTITIDIYEYEDGCTYKYMNAWSQLIKAPNHMNYPPVVYKHNIKVYRLDTTKQDLTEDTYFGYFISSLSDKVTDYNSSDILTYNIKFTGDSQKRTNYNLERLTDLEAQILKQRLKIDAEISGIGKDDIAGIVRDSIRGSFS